MSQHHDYWTVMLPHDDVAGSVQPFVSSSSSICRCDRPINTRDDFQTPPSCLTRTDCLHCLSMPATYLLPHRSRYAAGCVQNCYCAIDARSLCIESREQDNFVPVYESPQMNHCHRIDGFCRNTRTAPFCTCPHRKRESHRLYLCPQRVDDMFERYVLPPKCELDIPVKKYVNYSVSEHNVLTPVQFNVVHKTLDFEDIHVKNAGNGDTKSRKVSEDIMEWKQKHMEQLQVQETEVSENNITDELKDIKTLAAVSHFKTKPDAAASSEIDQSKPMPTFVAAAAADQSELKPAFSANHYDNDKIQSAEEKCKSPDTEQLKVELRRQEMKVKLYESMLRKQRLEINAMKLTMKEQTALYEERISELQKNLIQMNGMHDTKSELSAREEYNKPSNVDSVDRTISEIKMQELPIRNSKSTKKYSDDDGDDLARLQQQINEEENAVCSLKEELTHKDCHLKKLRTTLKEISSCNEELLEKNIELEKKISEKLSTKPQTLESIILNEIDKCIVELKSVAEACVAVMDGTDSLPIYLLQSRDEDFVEAAVNDGSKVNDIERMKLRLKRVTEMHEKIDSLREVTLSLILTNRYKQS